MLAKNAPPDELLPALEKRALLELDRRDGSAAIQTYSRIGEVLKQLRGVRPYWQGRLAVGLAWANHLQGNDRAASHFLSVAASELSQVMPRQPETEAQHAILSYRVAGGENASNELATAARGKYAALKWPSRATTRLFQALP